MARQSQKIEDTQESDRPENLKDTQAGQTGTKEAGGTASTNGSGELQGLANGEAVAAVIRANQVLLEGMTAMQRELLEFGNARLRKDLESQEELSHCKDVQEAMRLQADFAQKAMQHYAEEMAKLMELSAKIGRDCWGPMEEATRAAFKSTGTR